MGACAIADRIMLLKDGKAQVILPPAEFLKSNNPAAAEFVAAMKGEMQ